MKLMTILVLIYSLILQPNQINCQVGALRFVIIGHSGFVDQLDALDDERLIM